MCCVVDCDRESMYKVKDLCQMHYFRFMRNGVFTLKNGRNSSRNPDQMHVTSNGYVVVYRPEHALARGTGYILQHREVLYNHLGDNTPDCGICGCKTSWEIYRYHVDHIDEDKENNDLSNLRMLCNSCNVGRTKKIHCNALGRKSVTIKGETKTPQEWSRFVGVKVSGSTIRRRLSMGFSDDDAVYSERRTHNSSD